MKAERQQRHADYYFIQPSTLKATRTRDEYFESDDQRYYDENYFITAEAARACAADIQDQFGDTFAELHSRRKQNDRDFIKAVKAIPEKYHLQPKDGKDNAKAAPLDACTALLLEITRHDKEAGAVADALSEVRGKIENFIADARKE